MISDKKSSVEFGSSKSLWILGGKSRKASEDVTLEQCPECSEESSPGRTEWKHRMEARHVKRPEDVTGLGHLRTGRRRWVRREG